MHEDFFWEAEGQVGGSGRFEAAEAGRYAGPEAGAARQEARATSGMLPRGRFLGERSLFSILEPAVIGAGRKPVETGCINELGRGLANRP